MLRYAAAESIRLYQITLSSQKGFCCAYRGLTGGFSCSEYGRRLVLRRGLIALMQGLPRQFARCREAATAISLAAAKERPPQRRGQGKRGDGLGPGDVLGAAGEAADTAECLRTAECPDLVGCEGAAGLEALGACGG